MDIAEELASLTLQLCSIPSETLHERLIADWVEDRCLEIAGAPAVHRIGNSIVCIPAGPEPGRPTVALVGHLDTVKCAEAQPTEIRDGRVYG